jgi:hypothetical protein
MKNTHNGYAQSLATKIFNQLINIQTNRHIKSNRPRLSNTGFLFNTRDIQRVIESHDDNTPLHWKDV